MREKETYRDNLEIVHNIFGEKALIPLIDAAQFLGIDKRTALKHWKDKFTGNKGQKYISQANLARIMQGGK